MPLSANQEQYNFSIKPIKNFFKQSIGQEFQPLLIIDDLAAAPESIIDYAANEARFIKVEPPQNFYPGIMSALPKQYCESVCDAIKPYLQDVFDFSIDDNTKMHGSFSIATVQPEQLHPLQRLPHIDTTYKKQLAVLHYLCDSSHGGTSFYRHKETGFETLCDERYQQYKVRCIKNFETQGYPAPSYMQGSNGLYSQTGSVEAKFNRLVAYPSHVLHSGNINPELGLSNDPRKGRLTANMFITFH